MNYPTRPKNSKPAVDIRKKRIQILGAILGLATLALILRLCFLQVANNEFLLSQGDARTIRTIQIPSYRGLITDRRGTPIAVSTPVDAIWINPKDFYATDHQLLQLSEHLNLPPLDIVTKIKQHAHRSFVYLKRGLTPHLAKSITDLNISGLYVQREFRRFYPAGPITAQLVGFTNIDDQGQAGIELAYNEVLKPLPGKKKVLEDRMGHWIKDLHLQTLPQEGENLALSIDLRIQTLAYHTLEQAVEKTEAKSATLVMMDIKTGEVLAMVSYPAFNPNAFTQRQGAALRNRALTDHIEPGSTIKTFSMISLLENSELSLDDEIETSPGYYRIGKHTIRDVHNYGKLSIRNILVKSSNIALSKLTIERPPEELSKTFKKFGLGITMTDMFPGEAQGALPAPTTHPFLLATHAFGYGMTVTPLQLAHAYGTIANGGIKVPVTLFKREEPMGTSEQIISDETAAQITGILCEVMSSTGTGKRAHIKGYKTAGKTGTTRLVGPQGYDPHRHNALFVGFTPVDQPRLATIVLIEEPSELNSNFYGGVSAAPVYADVVKGALHILNVPPDHAFG